MSGCRTGALKLLLSLLVAISNTLFVLCPYILEQVLFLLPSKFQALPACFVGYLGVILYTVGDSYKCPVAQ